MSNIFAEFLVNEGLYNKVIVTKDNIEQLCDLLDGKEKIESYCFECKEKRVFSMKPIWALTTSDKDEVNKIPAQLGNELRRIQMMFQLQNSTQPGGHVAEKTDWYWRNWIVEDATRIISIQFICAKDDKHFLDYVVRVDGDTITKIGQFPSVADLGFPALKNYEKVMSKEDRGEMGRAIGLYASGIGVGSYVYLRRILERILSKAKNEAGDSIDLKAFNEARVGEKIDMLKDYLPVFLTSNKTLYGVLSQGVHELSEADCIAYFPIVRDSIFMILDQWEELRKKEVKEKEISAGLAKIASNIN